MRNFKFTTLSIVLASLLIAVIGCGNTDTDDRLDVAGELHEDNCRLDVSESLLSVIELTDEVNHFVADGFNDTTEPAEIKTAMTGFAEEYAGLAGSIETSDMTETDELALTLAREGEVKAAALAGALAEKPGVVDYSDATVVDWGEYADSVYAAAGEESAITGPGYVNRKGDGRGRGKGIDNGYGWWKEDFAADDGQYRDRDRDQYRDSYCPGDPKYDGSETGPGRGTGPRDGSGPGRGKGYGKGKGR